MSGGRGRGGGGEQLGFDDLLGAGPTHPALVPVPSSRRAGARRAGVARGTLDGVQEPLLPAAPVLAGPLDAGEIARLLGRPMPTPEQVEVIEAPLEPLLVVAGAGAGKTETMAARVVWLVANGLVAPEEVLGLTFTRKAAGELAERVRSRLRALARRLPAPEPGLVDDAVVTVSTYHSYAAAVLADHGLRLGVEPGAQLLGEAAAWQPAPAGVPGWGAHPRRAHPAPDTLTQAPLRVARGGAAHPPGPPP